MGFLMDIFSFQKSRYSVVEELAEDMLKHVEVRLNNITQKLTQGWEQELDDSQSDSFQFFDTELQWIYHREGENRNKLYSEKWRVDALMAAYLTVFLVEK